MKKHTLGILVLCIALLVLGIAFKGLSPSSDSASGQRSSSVSQSQPENHQQQESGKGFASAEIDRLTKEEVVVKYLRQNKRLPDYYITKSKARSQGWDARDGNLCSVLPGKAIGGDRFSNREGALPKAAKRIWFEADINYRCGHRGAERLLYSNDGLIYVTYDHYERFTEVKN